MEQQAVPTRAQALLSALPSLLLYGCGAWFLLAWGHEILHDVHRHVLLLLSVIALWRYGWQVVHYLRGAWYAAVHYPRLRAAAQQVAAQRAWPKRIYVVVPS